jgi:hypothetical protein
MRRNLLITALVILLLGCGVVAYFFFATSQPGVAVTPGGTTSLPIAGQAVTPGEQTEGNGDTTIYSPGTPVSVSSRLVQISKGPVVPGAVVRNVKTGSGTSSPVTALVTYIERQSGNVFTFLGSTHTLTRINNKTIPGIQSAAWLPDGSAAFVRYLSGTDFSTINTYALAATSSQGFFLPQNLSSIAVSSTTVLTVASGVNGSIASLQNKDGSHTSTLFATPLTSLRASFAGKNQYLVFSKPSATLLGDAFLVNASGHFSRIAGPLFGLSALASPSGKWVLVSYTESSQLRMQLVNTVTGSVLPLPLSTLADKCVWSADEASVYCGVPVTPAAAAYPDDWYQGVTAFSDRIWIIHIAERYAQMILDFPSLTTTPLDAVALAVDPAQTMLVFMNKNDDSLWSYAL